MLILRPCITEYHTDDNSTRKQKLSAETLYEIARAAYELSFDNTHEWAAQELMLYWPSELDKIPSKSPSEDTPGHAMDALKVSTDADIPNIRKAAFYELLRLPDYGQGDQDASETLRHADYNILTRARHHCAEVWMDVLLTPPRRSNKCAEQEKESGDARTKLRSSG